MSKVPIYAKAPMTARTGELFAYRYGFEDVEELAGSLPADAQVIDVGAGKSTFGERVCNEREDVQWTNVDLRYAIPGMIDRLSGSAPANLRFVPADVLRLTDEFDAGQFDRVYSYWLLPHMGMAGREVGTKAARNMLEVASSSGEVATGPCRPLAQGVEDTLFRVNMSDVAPEELDTVAADMAEAARYRLFGAAVQYIASQACSLFERADAVLPEHLARSA